MTRTIRVLIADDEAVLRAALADVIASDDALELVGAARDADEAIELAEATRPHVALVDVRMPGGGGFRVAEELRARVPEARVLAYTAVGDRTTVVRMLEAGAVGFLVKGTDPSEILSAVMRAARGQPSVSPEVMSGLVRQLAEELNREEAETAARAERTDRIRRAIDGDGRSVAYQPIVGLDRRELVGLEALARFTNGMDRPVQRWFREAAEVGLGTELELACIRAAMADLPRTPASTFLSVNVSCRTAESGSLVETLDAVDASRVVVEITEHEQVEDYGRLSKALGRLRGRGVRVAIDDAGAGFASLRHILFIQPEIIKLDIDLTRGIDSDAGKIALATALISFADKMGMMAVAEGIETETELAALRELGVRFGQGYFLGRPGPLDGEGRPG